MDQLLVDSNIVELLIINYIKTMERASLQYAFAEARQ